MTRIVSSSLDRSRSTWSAQAGAFACGLLICQAATADVPAALIAEGSRLYDQSCVMCHYDGRDSLAAPPLIGSAMVKSPDPATLIRAIVHGLANESVVDGKLFGGIMPATAGLSDEEVAALVTFVRKEYGGVAVVTTPAEVVAASRPAAESSVVD
jgi:mono/diheme cytochrome c family protein